MTKDKTLLWVHPDFKRMIKSKASQDGKTILDYTKDLAKNTNLIEDRINKNLKEINKNFSRLL